MEPSETNCESSTISARASALREARATTVWVVPRSMPTTKSDKAAHYSVRPSSGPVVRFAEKIREPGVVTHARSGNVDTEPRMTQLAKKEAKRRKLREARVL